MRGTGACSLLLFLLAAAAPGRAEAATQGSEPATAERADERPERVELRVTGSEGPGRAVVDRGARDGVAEGDRVFLRPLAGGVIPGIVARVDERSAVVALHERGAEPPPGTKGEVLVPAARRAALRAAPAETPRATAPELPEHPPWANADEAWTEDMPLLAQVDAVPPAERAFLFSGRAWLIADGVASGADDRTDLFTRFGTDLLLENAFGRGGELRFSGELDWRDTFVEDQVDVSEHFERIERLSYARGGTRFERDRIEVGRFLLHGMPEFGIVDGVEYSRRLAGGDVVGGSMGWMPEPDAEMESGHDFQLSAYYLWTLDETERLTLQGGFQKTFHQTRADRDLFVGKVRYLPEDGWDVHGTFWVDFYGSRDVAKDGVELTQAYLGTSRRWTDGTMVDVTYSRLSFPELQRWEFPPPFDLAGARNDRLAVTGWLPTSRSTRLHGQIGAWKDEEDEGGDVEIGLEREGVLSRRGHGAVSLVAAYGEFSKLLAARVSYGSELETGRWSLLYEASHAHQHGFAPNNDEIYGHWIRATRDWRLFSDWDLSVHADARVWEEDESLGIGVYLQWRFY